MRCLHVCRYVRRVCTSPSRFKELISRTQISRGGKLGGDDIAPNLTGSLGVLLEVPAVGMGRYRTELDRYFRRAV